MTNVPLWVCDVFNHFGLVKSVEGSVKRVSLEPFVMAFPNGCSADFLDLTSWLSVLPIF